MLLQPSEQATMSDLDDYLEQLYDDLPAKIRGTAMILQLARTPDNLQDLATSGESFGWMYHLPIVNEIFLSIPPSGSPLSHLLSLSPSPSPLLPPPFSILLPRFFSLSSSSLLISFPLSHIESILLALSRVLREDWKKSIDLTTNIVYTFFCFSTFSIFHRLLSQHKVRQLMQSKS